jgi:Arc/MetJ-type ribon-helix-helix transcriptional regulator
MKMPRRVEWCVPVTKTLDEALEKAVSEETHSSKSEFVRDAVRRRLEEMGFNPQVFNVKNETPAEDKKALGLQQEVQP